MAAVAYARDRGQLGKPIAGFQAIQWRLADCGTEREAAELVRRAGCRTERHPDGSVCYSWQGVEVEHHTRLFDLHNPLLRGYLSSLVGRHGFTDIRTEDGATLPVPAPLPDLLLLNAHLLKHIMGHGVGLRQFCDMARAYHALHGSYSPVELEAAYRRTGLLRWSAQLLSPDSLDSWCATAPRCWDTSI